MRNSHLEERESDWTREIYHVCMKEILVGLVEINSHEFEVKPESAFCALLQPLFVEKVQIQVGKQLDFTKIVFFSK